MNELNQLILKAEELEKCLGYRFQERKLMAQAFTHRSYANEIPDVQTHNERMEFLGDSVLALLISDFLYQNFPDFPEGELSFLRSRLVEAASCVKYLEILQVEKFILLGKGEAKSGGRSKPTILADLFEAIIGAIYLDGGFEAAREFLFSHFSNEIESIIKSPLHNWKAILQDWSQKKYHTPPVYRVVSEEGPDHKKQFHISVFIMNQELGKGIGHSKKEAEQDAAKNALSKMPEYQI